MVRLALTESIAVHGVIPRVLPALAESTRACRSTC